MADPDQSGPIDGRDYLGGMRDIPIRTPLEQKLYLDRNRQLAEIHRLRTGIKRIADGYGGDVESFAKSLLEEKS